MAAPKGNKNAAGKREWSSAIRKRVVQRKAMDELADKLIDKALDGDHQALREIGDRLEGKSVQSVGNANDIPFTIIVQR